METLHTTIERLRFTTEKAFDDVLAGLYGGISRPDIVTLTKQLRATRNLEEFERVANAAAGPASLLEFLHLNLGSAVNIGSTGPRNRMIRIIAGNPAIMRKMTEWIPDAGSYAPITILLYESNGRVIVCYDRVETILAGYKGAIALQVAKDLDTKVINLIERAIR